MNIDFYCVNLKEDFHQVQTLRNIFFAGHGIGTKICVGVQEGLGHLGFDFQQISSSGFDF